MTNDKRIRHLNRVLAAVFEGIVSYEQIVGQCMPLHLKVRPVLEEWLGCPVYFTPGWVDDGTPKGVHKFDDAMMADKLANGHQDDTINIHVWLTLPTMEIYRSDIEHNLQQGSKEGAGEGYHQQSG